MAAQQREVIRLVGGHAAPVAVVIRRHALEAPDSVERQVDRVELDVRHRVHQGGAAFRRCRRAASHLGVREQFRSLRAAGQGGGVGGPRRRVVGQGQVVEVAVQGQRSGGLLRGVAQQQGAQGALADFHCFQF